MWSTAATTARDHGSSDTDLHRLRLPDTMAPILRLEISLGNTDRQTNGAQGRDSRHKLQGRQRSPLRHPLLHPNRPSTGGREGGGAGEEG